MWTRASRAFARYALGLVIAALASTSASPARADDPVTTRFMVFTGGAFGGDYEISYDGSLFSGTFSNSLAATPLVGVRGEVEFLHYLGFGGQLVTSFWRDSDASRRNPMIDLSITPRVRVPIVIDGRYLLEPYLVIPVGFSLAIWNSSVNLTGGLDRANPGLNLGALAGVTFLTRRHVGAFLEFGWMHHVAYDSDQDGARFSLTTNQATLHAGVVYAY